ncbi:MAG TPA: hypothetical protein VEP69_06815, partial [Thermodesulfovibrionales bacterium]|nr:hypothetical protein [Thermodesulfovibrionales bacterium]
QSLSILTALDAGRYAMTQVSAVCRHREFAGRCREIDAIVKNLIVLIRKSSTTEMNNGYVA